MLIEYIDIAFSQIKSIDLFDCDHLERVVTDKSQRIEADISVAVEYIYDTSRFVDQEKVSLGASLKGNLGELQLKFDENIVSDYI